MNLRSQIASCALALCAGWAFCGGAAAEQVEICYNYGCNSRGQVEIGELHLSELGHLLSQSVDARSERALLAQAIGRMYGIAGEQTPVWRDKGGNLDDGGVNGQMDCIDHSTTTTAFLRMLHRRGWIHFHEVLEPVKRARLYFFAEHWTAQIREPGDKRSYAVDSWYFDNGQPAVVVGLDEWRKGRIPNVPSPRFFAGAPGPNQPQRQ